MQFGFKSGLSTGLCTNVLKTTVDYYTTRGSHVFCCFVDFSKAFDRVNYWKLFSHLISDGGNSKLVRLLSYWYSHQRVRLTVLGLVTARDKVVFCHLFCLPGISGICWMHFSLRELDVISMVGSSMSSLCWRFSSSCTIMVCNAALAGCLESPITCYKYELCCTSHLPGLLRVHFFSHRPRRAKSWVSPHLTG